MNLVCGFLAPGRPGWSAPLNLNPSLFMANWRKNDQSFA